MTGRAPRPLRLLLAVVFLAAGAGSSPGVHDCPRHADAGASVPVAGTGDRGHGGHGARAGAASHRPAPDDGPCRCLGDCHDSAVTPLAPAAPAALPAAAPASLAAAPAPPWSVRGPRHRLFELHLPNAPPRTI